MGLGNGNSKTGDKGSNYSYELKSLQGLQQSLTLLTGVATEGTLLQVLAAIIASDQDIEILLVRDEAVGNGNPVLKQVTNYETGVPVVSYENVDGTPYVPAPNPVPVYVYLDPSAVLNLMLAELITLNAGGQLLTEATFTESATPSVLDISGLAGSTVATWKSFTIVCIDGTFDFEAATFPPGAYTFSNGNGTLASIAYDATGSADCKIIYIS